MLTPDQKGAIAESSIAAAAIKLGIEVYRPLCEGGRYDFIFDIGRLVRVQCKWAPYQGDVICVRLYSSRRTRAGVTRRLYTAMEIDAIAAYCPEFDRCYYLPYERFNGRAQVLLRVGPTANNQRMKVNWAGDYELERLNFLPRGAVAQLGERRDGIAKATGSSPVGSTPLTLVD
jgi:hypothetical protein